MSERQRLFVAVELPDEARRALSRAQEWLRRGSPPIKWVAPEAMHLTLQFLGETDSALLPSIGDALRAAAGAAPAPVLHLAAAGSFPSLRRPDVLWIALAGELGSLQALQRSIAAALAPLGFPPETRPYHPHITLGRVRRDAGSAERQQLGARLRELPPLPPISWRVEALVLFESQLRREGPRYTARDSVAL